MKLLPAAPEVVHSEKSWLPVQLSDVPTKEKFKISARWLFSAVPYIGLLMQHIAAQYCYAPSFTPLPSSS